MKQSGFSLARSLVPWGVFCALVGLLVLSPNASATSVDRSFGDSGTRSLNHRGTLVADSLLDEFAGQPSALAIDHKERILIGGGSGAESIVYRLNPNGSSDRSFGKDGMVKFEDLELSLEPEYEPDATKVAPRVRAIVERRDHKILLVIQSWNFGFPSSSTYENLLLLREDGSRVKSWGGTKFGGTRQFRIGAGPRSAVLMPDGGITVSGNDQNSLASGDGFDGYIDRRRRNGHPDTSFGAKVPGNEFWSPGTIVFVPKGPSFQSAITQLRLQGPGKLLAAGHDRNRLFVTRLNPDGTTDHKFGSRSTPGKTIARYGGPKCFCVSGGSMAVGPNGGIVQVGFERYRGKTRGQKLVLVRYMPDGRLDSSFGGDGIRARFFSGYVRSTGIAVQVDGKILVTAMRGPSHESEFMVLRFKANGKLDQSFFDNGQFKERIGDVSTADRVVIDSKGRAVIAGGAAVGGTARFIVKRFKLR